MKKTLGILPTDLSSVLAETTEGIQAHPEYLGNLGMATLLWIFYAKTLLEIDHLRDALPIPSSDSDLKVKFRPLQKYMVERYHGLVLVDDESIIARLSHYSI